jgi:transketolase
VDAGKANANIVALTADLAESTRVEWFQKEFPDRFIEMGVAEQNLVTVASGMANVGKIPFITSYATFSPGRNWEQIRTTVCINDMPVKVIGCHAGLTVGPDGATHQALEDIAIMRALPNMTGNCASGYASGKRSNARDCRKWKACIFAIRTIRCADIYNKRNSI